MMTMSSDDIDAMIDAVRERRLKAVRIYEQALVDAKAASDDRARLQLVKQAEMLANNVDRLDKAINAAEARAHKIRALRLELGLE